MLVTIQQTKSNFENLFEISCNGRVLFQAKAPWMNVSLPFQADHIRKLVFFDSAGQTIYTTRYGILDNALEESIPYKYLITKEQRFNQFEIIGRNGREGAFYTLQKGLFDKRFCIEHNGLVYLGYDLEHGKTDIVSVYEDDKQVAQITKPLVTIDNLDIYYLHIKDELASMIPVLSFFVIYFDYIKYNNSGEITKNSVEISLNYSYDKNNSKYNPGWIAQEFGQEAADELDQVIREMRAQSMVQIKKYAKITGICLGAGFLLAAIITFVVLLMVTANH